MTADEFRKMLDRFHQGLKDALQWKNDNFGLKGAEPWWHEELDKVWRDLDRECALMKDAERPCYACEVGSIGGIPRDGDVAVIPSPPVEVNEQKSPCQCTKDSEIRCLVSRQRRPQGEIPTAAPWLCAQCGSELYLSRLWATEQPGPPLKPSEVNAEEIGKLQASVAQLEGTVNALEAKLDTAVDKQDAWNEQMDRYNADGNMS